MTTTTARVLCTAIFALWAAVGCGDDFPTEGSSDAPAADGGHDGSVGGDDTAQDVAQEDGAVVDGAVEDGGAQDTAAGACTTAADCSGAVGPCQVNVCLPTGACVAQAKPDGSACDDGDPCLLGETCQAGSCTPGWNGCPCKKPGDTAFEDCETTYGDGDACNGTLYCEVGGATPGCKTNPKTVVQCAAGTDCLPQTCDPKSGACTGAPALSGTACDDGDPCTKGEACAAGVCGGGQSVCPCTTSADCASEEDGDLCNGTLYCDNATFPPSCKVNPATLVTCKPSEEPCTSVTCDPKAGACVTLPMPKGSTCTDGDVCTTGDGCEAGSCKPGTPSCKCKTDADCAAQDDQNLCNGSLYCDTSAAPYVCRVNPKSVVTCDTSADAACEHTACVEKTGKCVTADKATGTPCSDGEGCTVGDTCAGGVCAPGPNQCACQTHADCAAFEDGDLCNGRLYCDKSSAKFVCKVDPTTVVVCNPSKDTACVQQTCAPKTGVCSAVALPEGATCDADGNPCTPTDTCEKGTCKPDPTNTCECVQDGDCAPHDDGAPCNGTLYCDTTQPGAFRCRVNPATVVTCATNNDTECLVNRCDAKSGKCAYTPVVKGASCNADNDACTDGDVCGEGVCVPGKKVCACSTDLDCMSPWADPCAGEPYCDKAGGAFVCAIKKGTETTCKLGAEVDPQCAAAECVVAQGKPACETFLAPVGTPCNDTLSWTVSDACTPKGTCAGKAALSCSTTADCFAIEADGNLCNGGLQCVASGPKGSPKFCLPTATPVKCLQGDPCTVMACEPSLGVCLPSSVTATFGVACDDGNACTSKSACANGVCGWVQATLDCDDANACTTDACDKITGCTHKAVTGPCTDGDPCTLDDACKGTSCAAGDANTCADGNPCTTDACQAKTGACTHTVDPACTPCKKDADCDDNNPCTTDTCDASKGCLQTPLNAGACSDKEPCTSQDACAKGVCKGTPTVCDDKLACTSDSCKPGQGCVFEKLSGKSCDDGDPCTTKDACDAGACLGTPKDCDDSNVCTADSCSGGACLATAVTQTTSCTDNDPCTEDDVCANKGCKGTAKNCLTGNACAPGKCVAGLCEAATVTSGSCDDQDPCTLSSTCVGGVCKAQKTKICDDKNPCTVDSCDSKTGSCKAVAQVGATCTDGDACTTADACDTSGACKGKAKTCDDSKACTSDACDTSSGQCVYTADAKGCPSSTCAAAACDSVGACTTTPQNEGKSCGSNGKKCANGSCGPCQWWSVTHTATSKSVNNIYAAVAVTSNGRVTLAGTAQSSSSAGKDSLWFKRVTALSSDDGGFLSDETFGNRVAGLAPGKDAGSVLGVTEATNPTTSASYVVPFTSESVDKSDMKSYTVAPSGGLHAITPLSAKHRWGVAATVPGAVKAGVAVMLIVDQNGKEKERITVDATGALTLTGVAEVGSKSYVLSGHLAPTPAVVGLLVAMNDKGTKSWQKSPSAAGWTPLTGVTQASTTTTVAGGVNVTQTSQEQGFVWAVKSAGGSTLWQWSPAGKAASTIDGVASAGDGGVVAVGQIVVGSQGRGLVARLSAAGKLTWQKELVQLDVGQLSAVAVSGDALVAAGHAVKSQKKFGWALRMKLDGTLQCAP